MTREMLASMREATRILRTSGPAEATAAIQRALQGTTPTADQQVTWRLRRPALAERAGGVATAVPGIDGGGLPLPPDRVRAVRGIEGCGTARAWRES